MKKFLKAAWVGPQIGWGGVSRNHQGGVNSISYVDENSEVVPTCAHAGRMDWRRAQQRNKMVPAKIELPLQPSS